MTILTPAARPRGYGRRRRRRSAGNRSFVVVAARRRKRVTGLLGLLFVGLAAVGIKLVALPDTESPAQTIAFIAENRATVLAAQTFSIVAALVFSIFAARLARSVGAGESGPLAWTGWGIAAAAMATGIAVAAIGLVASPRLSELVTDLVSLQTGLDVLLALAIASFSGAVALDDGDLPTFVRIAGGVTAVLAVGAAAAGWAGTPTAVEAPPIPIVFLTFIGVLAGWLLVGRGSTAQR